MIWKILFALGVTIAFFIIRKTINHILVRKKNNKEFQEAANVKLRDENLNNIILNDHKTERQKRHNNIPYEVNYDSGDMKKFSESAGGVSTKMMVQLIEKTELSSRKFVLPLNQRISIGSGIDSKNDIVVMDSNVAEKHCELFAVKSQAYIKSTCNEKYTILKRKKEQVIVDNKGIRLMSGDVIDLGSVTYTVSLMN